MTFKDVIIVVGPTASGKRQLAHAIAQNTGGEIISADSMKIYRMADIGTSKPQKKYTQEVKYHLIDIIEPDERYDLGQFFSSACGLIDDMHKRDILPIVSGGTSLYISKIIDGLAAIPPVSSKIIKELEKESVESLYAELMKVDPERASELHPNMKRRIVRALGVFRQSGKKMSQMIKNTSPPDYNTLTLLIDWPRERLYERINRRVDRMIDEGLIEEVRQLLQKYGEKAPVFEGVGYKEFLPFLRGEISLEEAKEDLKKASRHYARRQLVWWRTKNLIRLDGEKLVDLGILSEG